MKRTIGIVECNYGSAALGPLTASRPAASIPFHGRYRLVDFALSNMVNAGVHTIGLIMPTNYRSIIDHVGAGKEWGLARKRGGLFPAPGSPFGCAHEGGRFLLRDLIMNRAIFTRNNYDYVAFSSANFVMNVNYDDAFAQHQASGAAITMLTQAVPMGRDDANVVTVDVADGRVTGCRMGARGGDVAFLDAFIINRETLMELLDWYAANDHLDLFEAMADDFGRIDVRTFDVEGYVAPIFNQKSYYDVSMDLLNPVIADQVFPADRYIMTKSHDSTPAKYEAGCHVSNSLVSSSCRISGEVTGSVLSRHVIVEPGARIVNSIIMQGTTVKAGAVIENAIVDRNNTIAPRTIMQGTPEDIFYCAKAADYRAGTDN